MRQADTRERAAIRNINSMYRGRSRRQGREDGRGKTENRRQQTSRRHNGG
jgi:hypothetical protein